MDTADIIDLPSEEVTLFFQMKNYDDSQKRIKELIRNNVESEIELYLINDEWLNEWKSYSCFDSYNFDEKKNSMIQWKNKRKERKNVLH